MSSGAGQKKRRPQGKGGEKPERDDSAAASPSAPRTRPPPRDFHFIVSESRAAPLDIVSDIDRALDAPATSAFVSSLDASAMPRGCVRVSATQRISESPQNASVSFDNARVLPFSSALDEEER